jgi:release factor glutamine methyltransferase
MPTCKYDPDISHLSLKDYNNIYEPNTDTWIFVDSLEQEKDYIFNTVKPSICVEVG